MLSLCYENKLRNKVRNKKLLDEGIRNNLGIEATGIFI